MPSKSTMSILDVESDPSRGTERALADLTLHDILSMDTLNVLKFLTKEGLLKDGGFYCSICPNVRMTLNKTSKVTDGYRWRCPKCTKAEHSLRDGSIFFESKLDIVTLFALLYCWAVDFDNVHAERELRLTNKPVTFWYARFRQVCAAYAGTLPKIGGLGKIEEFDETCLVHQKHHRGKEKPGTQVWYCVGVERDSGGRCFVKRVKKRDIPTLDKVLKDYIAPGTALITDEWRATLNSHLRLTEQQFTHFLIKHKEAYARWVNIEDEALAATLGIPTNSEGNRWLRVHTNKCEGLNAHLKHKLKRIRGTALHYVDGYLQEAAFRQNARAMKYTSML